MSKYLFIESREPFECVDSQLLYSLAQAQAVAGHEVTVFLAQNGALLAHCGAKYEAHLVAMRAKGVRMLADDFSLQERALIDLTPEEQWVF